jgi:hypothetical protein
MQPIDARTWLEIRRSVIDFLGRALGVKLGSTEEMLA